MKMSSCIIEIMDYGIVKKCKKCGKISLRSDFHEDETKNDGLKSNCKVCRKNQYKLIENRIKIYLKKTMNKIEKTETYISKTKEK